MKLQKNNEAITPIEHWVLRTEREHGKMFTTYDRLCELAVSQYNLKHKCRQMDFLDVLTFFYRWWNTNKKEMSKYNSLAKIGRLTGSRDHATVLHHLNERVPTNNYKENTLDIKDFLES